ncbi:hypothetical protein CLAFUW4_10389 [Fulvia fulva]|uniref:Uncharacterized protein n=1 Tax=Passalora fulva TaxID=5499 RepID=A0A9Q8LE18_PASFU|nr:uncharacterized protein CLAFUR5_05004 [Fulvia fulva]KAK4616191.1 hypothetical protein CLAFUR4_10393 [Fulvia fulva]KAK4617156.1 hypothetical protein CLAFUR0_10394 [Fulvia fulva]UJO15701.1 hypothetical protein CLAFUR5_05004 [Fulvia fulva]WPV19166.1 hypothetical protein CLAFUW4_10389 [Fulvia fulva]WPV34028.1 hypothetical protein CLAFUW7_10389 [Fulvia fulva]
MSDKIQTNDDIDAAKTLVSISKPTNKEGGAVHSKRMPEKIASPTYKKVPDPSDDRSQKELDAASALVQSQSKAMVPEGGLAAFEASLKAGQEADRTTEEKKVLREGK